MKWKWGRRKWIQRELQFIASAINKTFSNQISFGKKKHLEVTTRESFLGSRGETGWGWQEGQEWLNGWHSCLPLVWIHLIYECLCRAPHPESVMSSQPVCLRHSNIWVTAVICFYWILEFSLLKTGYLNPGPSDFFLRKLKVHYTCST